MALTPFGLNNNQYDSVGLRLACRADPDNIHNWNVGSPLHDPAVDGDQIKKWMDVSKNSTQVGNFGAPGASPIWRVGTGPSGATYSLDFVLNDSLELEESRHFMDFLKDQSVDWSIMIRVCINENPTTQQGNFYGTYTGAAAGILLGYRTPNIIRFAMNDGGAADTLDYSFAIVQNTFYTIVITSESATGEIKMFIDDFATEKASGTFTRYTGGNNNLPFEVGGRGGGTDTMVGEYMGIIICQKLLTASEMASFNTWIQGKQ